MVFFMVSNNSKSINFVKLFSILKKNAPQKDGTIPIMVRITIDRKIAQFSTKLSVDVKKWDLKFGRVIGRKKQVFFRKISDFGVNFSTRGQVVKETVKWNFEGRLTQLAIFRLTSILSTENHTLFASKNNRLIN